MAVIVHWGKFYPPDMGGIESVTCSLARGARLSGHDVKVVCFGAPQAEPETDAGGVTVVRAPAAFTLASQPLGWRYVWRLLAAGRGADIVHLHTPNMLAALASLLLGRRPRLVVHWHSDVVGKGLLARLLRPLETLMLRRADAVIATSPPYLAASQPLQAVRDKVRVIPLGVPDAAAGVSSGEDALPMALRRRLAGRRLVLGVGRLVPYKGFAHLIDAAAQLPDDVVVVIVGGGPLQGVLQARIAAAGVADKVVLAGRLPDAALRALFARAALYCLPSVERSEAFGVVLIEAMSWRLPIVATSIAGSGVPWVNNHGVSGLNVPPGDAAALAEACNRILSSPVLRAQLATGARRRFEGEFAEAISVQRTNDLYDGLLAGACAGKART